MSSFLVPSGKACPALTVADATPDTTDRLYETEVEFTCDLGFLRQDGVTQEDMVTTCTATSVWSDAVQDCRRMYMHN